MLHGPSIVLRCLEEYDLPLIARWRNQKDVRRYFFDKSLLPISGQKKWFERYLDDRSREIFVAVHKEQNMPVGMIGLYRIDNKNRKAEIGSTMIGERTMRGKGAAAEMMRLLLDYAFADLGLNRLYAYAIDYNTASVKLKLHCGFQREGILHQDHYADGRFYDVYLLAITRDDWEKQQRTDPFI